MIQLAPLCAWPLEEYRLHIVTQRSPRHVPRLGAPHKTMYPPTHTHKHTRTRIHTYTHTFTHTRSHTDCTHITRTNFHARLWHITAQLYRATWYHIYIYIILPLRPPPHVHCGIRMSALGGVTPAWNAVSWDGIHPGGVYLCCPL